MSGCHPRMFVREEVVSGLQVGAQSRKTVQEQTDHDRFYYRDQFLQYKEELPAFITLRKDH